MQLHSAHKKALNKTKSLGCYSINDDIKALWAMWAVTKISLQENRQKQNCHSEGEHLVSWSRTHLITCSRTQLAFIAVKESPLERMRNTCFLQEVILASRQAEPETGGIAHCVRVLTGQTQRHECKSPTFSKNLVWHPIIPACWGHKDSWIPKACQLVNLDELVISVCKMISINSCWTNIPHLNLVT